MQAWVANKNNLNGGWWLWIAIFYSAIPVWPVISRISKNLLFDGMVYDIILFLSYVVTLLCLGTGKAFNLPQWIGLAFVILGVILMKARI